MVCGDPRQIGLQSLAAPEEREPDAAGLHGALALWTAKLRQEKLESRVACLWMGGGGDLGHVVVVGTFNPGVQKALWVQG